MSQKIQVQNNEASYEIEIGDSPQLHKVALPDSEFEGERHRYEPVSVAICATHAKTNWTQHEGYRQSEDGSINCITCPWGSKIAGWFRVKDNKIVDLRVKASQ